MFHSALIKQVVVGLLVQFVCSSAFSQISIHQEEWLEKTNLGISAEDYYAINTPQAKVSNTRSNCNLNKVVYGWHPYWSNGLQSNYDWNLLSHLCYFSYEVNASNGNANSTHSFSTTQVVTDALNNGVRVDLCVTLFSNHATFFASSSAQQTLITNLINLISARGAHGVNIDFEGLPSSQKTNFRNFMNNLANQMHAAIPGSQVSTVLYAVDWNDVFDIPNMSAVDYFIIMGYDYYWSGSSNTGPNDPLFHFGSTYNYTLSKSVTYYLDKGVPANKLVLGLPYYGREWATSSSTVPGTTTASGTARTYSYVRNNTSGFYTPANKTFDQASQSGYYVFNNSGWRQCFITEAYDMNKRLDFIKKRGIAGMGIWALGYDDGYNDFWNAIANNLSDCATTPCSDSIYDIGGGFVKNYYDKENYTYTLSPTNAQSINVHFINFNLENNYDFLYLYDGPSTASPQISGSPFTGTTLPADFSTSSGHLTVRFTSDGATTAPGFLATYSCVVDNTPPVSTIVGNNNWKTTNFPITLNDTDAGSGIASRFWQVLDNDGVEWRANASEGFFNDNFTTTLHSDWSNQTGTWLISSSQLRQSDANEGNSNLYTPLTQSNSYSYLYHWQAKMEGSGTNRRSGLHFFVDNPTLPNRGNSYFVYFRVDSDKCQIYKVVNDVYTLVSDNSVVINPSTFYDYKISYNPQSGKIIAWVNSTKVGEWTDSSPLQSGNFLSLRSGGTDVYYDDVKVYRTHTTNETITIGNASSMVRYQNNGQANPSCRIKSLSVDQVGNWSSIASKNENIDWTNPISPMVLEDGNASDIDTSNNNTTYTVNWQVANDPHSAINRYEVALGTAPGLSDIKPFTSANLATTYTITGIFLNYGSTYYASLKSVNNAGLSSIISSDGVYIQSPSAAPTASFINQSNSVCINDSVQMINNSANATAFSWSFPGGSPATSSAVNPSVYYANGGSYAVTLIAYGPGGNDTLTQTLTLNVLQAPQANFSVNSDTLYLPNAFLALTNLSTNGLSYYWDFGNGQISSDENPWLIYSTSGNYDVMLIASNYACADDILILPIVVIGNVSVEENDLESKISIYPNPTQGVITIQNTSQENFKLEIFSVEGKLIYSVLLSLLQAKTINLSEFHNGMYLLRFNSDDHSFTKRIIKQ